FLFGNFADLARAPVFDLNRAFSIPNSLCARILISIFDEIFVKPSAPKTAGLHAEIGEHLEICPWLERSDFLLARGQDGKRGRLHATGSCFLKTASARIK